MSVSSWLVLGVCALWLGCSGGGSTPPPSSGSPRLTTPPTYVVEPPPGKVPLPHQAPSTSLAAYGQMKRDLFIVNNFGLFQAMDPSHPYLHSGTDFVLSNGTPIYALQEGTVSEVSQGTEFYKSVTVVDASDPNSAWQYVHVDDFEVSVGDHVFRGQPLARIRFQGLEHLHLSRLVKWSNGRWYAAWAEDRFDLPEDPEPPTLQPMLYFSPVASDVALVRASPMVLSGAIQVFAGVRDGGPNFRTQDALAFGDRLAPRRFRLVVRDAGGLERLVKDFDFARLLAPSSASGSDMVQMALRLYGYPKGFDPNDWTTRYSRCFSYYALTRIPDLPVLGPPPPAADGDCWDTAARTPEGQPRFPNGTYTLDLTVWDAAGNSSSLRDRVDIRN